MPNLSSQLNITIGSTLYTASESASYGTNDKTGPVIVPVAKAGTLSTRTSDTEGTITGSTGHGITTGQKLDIQWSDGRRYNVTVGTVDGNSIPISLGAGDNLPDADTALVFATPVEISTAFDGTACKAFAANSTKEGVFTIQDAGGVEAAYDLDGSNCVSWLAASGIANPIDGDSIVLLTISNFSTEAAALFNFDTLLDSVA